MEEKLIPTSIASNSTKDGILRFLLPWGRDLLTNIISNDSVVGRGEAETRMVAILNLSKLVFSPIRGPRGGWGRRSAAGGSARRLAMANACRAWGTAWRSLVACTFVALKYVLANLQGRDRIVWSYSLGLRWRSLSLCGRARTRHTHWASG
jgi:hypothetical protein